MLRSLKDYFRSLKDYSKEILVKKLQEFNFPSYINFNDINIAYTDFSNRLIAIIEKIAPLKQICIRNNYCEWIDQEILNGIRIRDKLFVHFRKTGLYSDHMKYKRARNNLQQLIKNKKINFISFKVEGL